MVVFQEFSAWGVKFDLAAMSTHPASTPLTLLFMTPILGVIVDAVVVFAEHGQVRRVSLAAILMGVDVVDLAPIGRHTAVRPGADKIFCRCQDALLEGRESGLVEIHRAGGWVEETGIEFVTKCSFDEFAPVIVVPSERPTMTSSPDPALIFAKSSSPMAIMAGIRGEAPRRFLRRDPRKHPRVLVSGVGLK